MPRDTRVFEVRWSNGDTRVCNRAVLSGFLGHMSRYRPIVYIGAADKPEFADVTQEFASHLRTTDG